MMDKIGEHEIKRLNKLVYEETKSLFKEKIDLIFFDATTLYFESFSEDEFKKNGYSKDGKFNQPQVVLALMVTKEEGAEDSKNSNCEFKLAIDEDKVKEDFVWDGLKGIITNNIELTD